MDKLNVSDLPTIARMTRHAEQLQPDQAQIPPLSSSYPPTQLADLSVAQHVPADEPQVDPFQALLAHRTTSFDEHSSYEDDNEVYISNLPTTDEGKPQIRTTTNIPKFAFDPSIERRFELALSAFHRRPHPTISSTTASTTTATVAAFNVAEDASVVEKENYGHPLIF